MLRYHSLLLICWLAGTGNCLAQTPEIDSLLTALSQHRVAGDQLEECLTLKQLSGKIFAEGEYERAMLYADSALAVLPPKRKDIEQHLNYIQYMVAAYQWQAYPRESLKLLDTAEQYLLAYGDPELTLPFLVVKGTKLQRMGRLMASDSVLRRAEQLGESLTGDWSTTLLDIYGRSVFNHENLGNFGEAIAYVRKARELWKGREPNAALLGINTNYAAILASSGENTEARRVLQSALADAKAIADSSYVSTILLVLATHYAQDGPVDSTPVYLQEASIYLDSSAQPGAQIFYNNTWAVYYYQTGQYERAVDWISLSVEPCRRPYPSQRCKSVFYEMARYLDTLGRSAEALVYLEESLVNAQREEDLHLESTHLLFMSILHEKLGNSTKAIDYLYEHSTLRDRIFNKDMEAAVARERIRQNVEEEQAARERAELKTELTSARSRIYLLAVVSLVVLLLLGGFLLFQLQRARKKLRTNNQELEALNATKDKFFGLIAHDIRSPIVALSGVGDQMQYYLEQNKTDKLSRLANRVEQTATGLTSLLDNLLQWALLQTGMIPYRPENVKLAKIVAENIRLYQEMAEMKSISLHKEVDTVTEVFADPRAVSTIVRNLLSNALKFTPQGGHVFFSARQTPQDVLLEIRDTGQGIEPAQLASLFSLEKNATRGTAGEKGSGLGLNMVKELVELNRGAISVESKPGEGSIFRVRLPRG